MKILMVSYRIPYPLTAGFRIRIYNEAKYLKSMGHQVDLVYLGNSRDEELYRSELAKVFDHISCFSIKGAEVLANIVMLTFLRGKPFQVALYWNRKMNSYIQNVAGKYDVIIGNAVRTAEYLISLPKDKTILDLHDAVSYNYLNLIKHLTGLKNLFYKIERKLLMRYECKLTRQIKRLFITSEVDKQYLKEIGADTDNITVIPVAVRDDIKDVKVDVGEDECALCFLGKMSYQPNADAVIWFCRNVFPILKENHEGLKFYILGIEPSDEIMALKSEGIEITGFLENPYKTIKRCMAMVVPIRNGAGMQNKILESMVVGTPCVISTIAEEGLGGKNGQTYIVADTVSEYVDAIEMLIQNPQTRKKIGEEASLFVKQYMWDELKYRLQDMIETNEKGKTV